MRLIYEDPLTRLYCGDMADYDGWAEHDVLIMDPPYGINYRRGARYRNGNVGFEGIQGDADLTARDRAVTLWGPDRPGFIFGAPHMPPPAGTCQAAVWAKRGDTGLYGAKAGMRRDIELVYLIGRWPRSDWSRLTSSVLAYSERGPRPTSLHPHQKPVGLIADLAGRTSGRILDPFAGTGTTLRVAKNLGRPAVGIEIDPATAELAARRLAQEALAL